MKPVEIRLIADERLPDAARFDAIATWLVVLPRAGRVRAPASMPYLKLLLDRRAKKAGSESDREPFVTDLPNPAGSRVALVCLKDDISEFELLTLARKLAATAASSRALRIGVIVHGAGTRWRERAAEAVLTALHAAAAPMPAFKRKPDPAFAPETVHLFGLRAAALFRRVRAESAGNALARWLSTLPPNRLTPAEYLKHIRTLARQQGWKLEFLDTRALKAKGAGAFLAVAQGSPSADAGIVRLRYLPRGRAAKPKIALVGKGICFDTGGVNLKTARHMFGMHGDMQGSAVALGLLQALTMLRAPFPVDCWLALAMNHIGPKSYKPNDVVTACDGTSIEVVHTDAEGRMVLADTLALCSRSEPGLILDFATLTGTCVYALGKSWSGVFSNRDAWLRELVEAGRASGERIWPFPLDEDYDEALESDIADIKQCAMDGEADHILAARFLQRFVPASIPWIHVDLAAGIRKGGLAHVPTEMTGFGVRLGLNLLLDRKLV
jgi:leucyl aminopeptidase